jgi:hypothetical protein
MKNRKDNPKQKQYTINNREAVALIDYMGLIVSVNMVSQGSSTHMIQSQSHSLTQQAGAIFLKFGYDGLMELVKMFIVDQMEKGKKVGKNLILPEYHFMNKQGQMVDIKYLIV